MVLGTLHKLGTRARKIPSLAKEITQRLREVVEISDEISRALELEAAPACSSSRRRRRASVPRAARRKAIAAAAAEVLKRLEASGRAFLTSKVIARIAKPHLGATHSTAHSMVTHVVRQLRAWGHDLETAKAARARGDAGVARSVSGFRLVAGAKRARSAA